ncbi:PucR family transcriptional regulator [Streptomyces sp. NPDC058579]|uniref:PucR family transcriptional regulator n=1 Tax=Streptomyces sp. NPDC058579 TaxID=3346548 RepID=UPI00364F911E
MPTSPPSPPPSAESNAVLTALATRVLTRIDPLTREIVRLIVANEPTYQARGAVPVGLLTQSVDGNVRRILEALAGVRRAPEEELSVARTTGRRRAEQGVPLEAVLRAYRLATELVLGSLLAEVRGRPYDELAAFLDVTSAVMKVMDRHSEAVVDGYRRAEAELLLRDAQRQQATFDALLEGRGSDPQFAAGAVDALGLPATGPYVMVVATFDLAAQHSLGATRDTCAAYSFPAAWRIRGDREIGIVALGEAEAPVQRLLDALRRHPVGRTGVSDPFVALHQIPEAYRAAELATRTVTPGDGPQVVWIAERLPEALIVSSPALAQRLAQRALGPLLAQPPTEREMLLRTLAVWYETGRSAPLAAERLYCHRNTVLNRLRRIEHLTARSLEDHRFLLACYLGLLTLRLGQDKVRPAAPASTT